MMGQIHFVFYENMEIGNEAVVRDGIKLDITGVKPGV